MCLRDEVAIVICWADVPSRVKLPSEMNPGDSGKMHPVKMDTSDLIFWQGQTSGVVGLGEYLKGPHGPTKSKAPFRFTAFYSTPFSWALTFMDWARGGDNGGIMRQGGLLTVAQHCLPIVTR